MQALDISFPYHSFVEEAPIPRRFWDPTPAKSDFYKTNATNKSLKIKPWNGLCYLIFLEI